MPAPAIARHFDAISEIARGPAHRAVAALEALYAEPLLGLHLKLDRYTDRLRPCCDNIAVVTPGVGPHAHGLRCEGCERHRGWLPRAGANRLRMLMEFGQLGPLPTLRDHAIVPNMPRTA
jgi:hypothetical protein